MRRSMIVDASLRLLQPSIVVLSLYFLFAGHNQPGGGFVGGLVFGAAIALRFVAGGVEEVRSMMRVRPWTVLGMGLVIASVTALVPLLLGNQLLEHHAVTWQLPVLGDVKFTTALPFDIGVYLVVAGLALMALEAFGDEPPTADEEPER